MCLNCAFSLEDRPNQCMECDICIRNPKNASIKFQPVKYKEMLIEKPIDMYISKELMAILREEIRKMYEEGLRRGQKPQEDYKPEWTPYPGRSWWWNTSKFIDNTTLSSSDTLTITYTVSIPTLVPVDDSDLPQWTSSQDKKEEPLEKKVIKTVCIDISELLGALDGVEVGEVI